MKNEQDLFLLIESYADGTLSDEEKMAFEKMLAENNDLKEAAELSRAAQKAIQINKLLEVKNLIREVHIEKKKGKFLKGIALLVGVLALGSLGMYLFLSHKQTALIPDPKNVSSKATTMKSETMVSEVKEMDAAKEASRKNNMKKQKWTVPADSVKSIVSMGPLSNEPAEIRVTTSESKVTAQVHEHPEHLSQAVSQPSEVTNVLDALCAHSHLEAHTMTEPSCLGQSTGRILVSGLKGGKTPYSVRYFNDKNQVVTSDNLPAGAYSVLIVDQQQCEKRIEGIKVKEESCKRNYELNTANGEVVEWGIATQATTLSVYKEGEITYFYKQFNIGDHIQWNGISSTGANQNGYFVFLLQYEDGTAQNGSITVFK